MIIPHLALSLGGLWFDKKIVHHTAISFPSRFYKHCFHDFLIIVIRVRTELNDFFADNIIDYFGNLIIKLAFCEAG